MDRLQWMSQLKRDPVHRKIMKVVKKRKFLLERMLEDRQHFPDEDDDDEDNACVPYGLRNE